MVTNSSIVNIRTEIICVDIKKNVETKFDNLSYELDRQLPKEKNNWINERWVTCANQDRFCRTETKNI